MNTEQVAKDVQAEFDRLGFEAKAWADDDGSVNWSSESRRVGGTLTPSVIEQGRGAEHLANEITRWADDAHARLIAEGKLVA